MLTRGLRRPELRRKEDDDDDRRRRGRALVEEGDAEVAGVLGIGSGDSCGGNQGG
jgi:hypothetical protein